MDEQLTHGDVMEIIETLREHGKRLRRLAARRDATGPGTRSTGPGSGPVHRGPSGPRTSSCAGGPRSSGGDHEL